MANQSALSKYQKLTDREHILKKPDTYIGSIENTEHEDYIFNDEKIISKGFQYIPGLYKLFDEGIVNCRDHVIRQEQAVSSKVENALPVSNIEINVKIGTGNKSFTAYTMDLTKKYIEINADYRS